MWRVNSPISTMNSNTLVIFINDHQLLPSSLFILNCSKCVENIEFKDYFEPINDDSAN